ncbi:tetratricopeptide repeat protein [Shouchella sp. 1P09AA]|uniref:tetratricopeptide repeat protein n=1 Tax=unclassified Shouchella TaxID=2893065 RepID=UPI0039A04C8B
MSKKQASEHAGSTVVPFYRSGDYFFHKGLAAFQNKHLTRAAKLFERAVKLTETEPVFKIQLAAVLTELAEYERSNKILYGVLEASNDEHPACHFFIANNEVYLGHFFQAEKHVNLYLTHDPEGPFVEDARELAELFEEDPLDEEEKEEESLNNHEKAWVFLTEGKANDAIPLLKKVIEIHPKNWAAQNHLAEALFRTGEVESAFETCDAVLAEDPGNLLALCNATVFYYKLGYQNETAHYVQMLKKIKPIQHDYKIRLLHVLCHLEEYEEVAFRKKDQTLVKESMLLRCFAVADYHNGNRDFAIHLLKEAISAGDSNAPYVLEQVEEEAAHRIFFPLMEQDVDMSMLVDNQPKTPLG